MESNFSDDKVLAEWVSEVLEKSRSDPNVVAYYDYRTDHLIALEGTNTYPHEQIHFLDHVASPYGLFLDSMAQIKWDGFRNLCSYFAGEDSPHLPIPLQPLMDDKDKLFDLLLASSGADFEIDACLRSFELFCFVFRSFAWLEMAMEGPKQDFNQQTIQLVPGALGLFEFIDESSLPDDILALNELISNSENGIGKWEWSREVAPKINVFGEPFQVGASSLMENRAFISDQRFSPSKKRRNKNLRELAKSGKNNYYALMLLVSDLIFGLDIKEMSIVHSTFNVLSDMALYTPIGKYYKPLRSENRWEDVHPGWRFLYFLKFIPKIGPFDSKQDVFEYQEKMAEAANFPPPIEFLKLGSNIAERNYREKRHKIACEQKLEIPRLFIDWALPEFPWPEEQILNFFDSVGPFEVVTRKSKGKRIFNVGMMDYWKRILFTYVQNLMHYCFILDNFDESQLLDHRFPYDEALPEGTEDTITGLLKSFIFSKLKFNSWRN